MANASVLPEWQKCFEAGRAALAKDDFDTAVEFLGQALQLSNDAHGDLSFKSAPYYLKYGQALLYKAQTERDVYTGPQAEHQAATGGEESDEEEEEEGDGGEAGPSKAALEGKGGSGLVAEEVDNEEEVEEEEEEEEGDLELAWKVIEAARLIYNKQPERSLEEVDVLTALADISLEKEQFSTCFSDYHAALTLLETLVAPDNRMLAQLYFKLCMAYQLDQNPAKALSYCERAVGVCKNRIRALQLQCPDRSAGGEGCTKEGEVCEGDKARGSEAANGEIAEIEPLLNDMIEKAEELQVQMKAPSLMDSLRTQNPQLLQEVRSVFASTATAASGGHGKEASGSGSGALVFGGSSSALGFGSASSFDAPQLGGPQVVATNLGVVGRGKKKVAPEALNEPEAKKIARPC